MSATTASDRVLHLRALRRDLQILCSSLHGEAGIEEAVGVGEELWATLQEAQKHLGTVKGIIRADVGDEPGTHILEGADGAYCNVNVQGPRAVLRPGTNLRSLERLLGSKVFNALFVGGRPHPKFMDKIKRITDTNHLNVLMGAVDLKTYPARVSFAKDKRNP